MSYSMHVSDKQEEIESMIDKYGLWRVLDMISVICEEKADHVESNWQDRPLAKAWRKAARQVSSAANKTKDVGR